MNAAVRRYAALAPSVSPEGMAAARGRAARCFRRLEARFGADEARRIAAVAVEVFRPLPWETAESFAPVVAAAELLLEGVGR